MKNLKMKALLVAAVVGFAQLASADYLMWDVDYSDSYDYAILYAVSSDTTTGGTAMSNYINTTTPGTATAVNSGIFEAATVGADLSGSSYSGYYFYVELYTGTYSSTDNSGATLVAASSSAVSYESLSTYVTSSLLSNAYIGYDNIYSFSATAVPEPTGGLLVLMGAALLGLRRKRRMA